MIAGYARDFEIALQAAGYGVVSHETPVPETRPDLPATPEPQAPAALTDGGWLATLIKAFASIFGASK